MNLPGRDVSKDGKDSSGLPCDPNLRIPTAMLLFAFEQCLGRYTLSRSTVTGIPARLLAEIKDHLHFDNDDGTLKCVVRATYLSEVLALAVASSAGTSEHEALRHIGSLFDGLKINDARNAVCHPNNTFPKVFWYSALRLAADPAIEQLGFRDVIAALYCVESNQITPPPDAWFDFRPSLVPNNLPASFDHSVTGLIGRQKELASLKKCLSTVRNNFIALVGPGGTGKTALCLEALKDVSSDPGTLSWTDRIIYLTAKTEKLSAEGIVPIESAIETIGALRKELAKSILGEDEDFSDEEMDSAWDLAIESVGGKNLLICVDNLETLIRDRESVFEELVQSLPPSWRVLVTSRVIVNGAVLLPVDKLSTEGAVLLARKYLENRTAERLTEDDFHRIAKACDNNPLAIRLVIDCFAAGLPLSEAFNQTTESIVNYSYKSLVDRLEPSSKMVMECLYVSPDKSLRRAEIANALGLSPDQVAEALKRLLNTSLITRQEDDEGEKYTLSSSVHDLLRLCPTDPAIRHRVQTAVRTTKGKARRAPDRRSNPFSPDYVDLVAPASVRALANTVSESLRRGDSWDQVSRQQVHADLKTVERFLENDSSSGSVHRIRAILANKLEDRACYISSLERAVACDDDDWLAMLLLAEHYRTESNFSRAVALTDRLMSTMVLDLPDVKLEHKARLLKTHWLSILDLPENREAEVIEATKDWKERQELSPVLAAIRLTALSQRLNRFKESPSEEADAVAHEIVACVVDAFSLNGYIANLVDAGMRALGTAIRYGIDAGMPESDLVLLRQFDADHGNNLSARFEPESRGAQTMAQLKDFLYPRIPESRVAKPAAQPDAAVARIPRSTDKVTPSNPPGVRLLKRTPVRATVTTPGPAKQPGARGPKMLDRYFATVFNVNYDENVALARSLNGVFVFRIEARKSDRQGMAFEKVRIGDRVWVKPEPAASAAGGIGLPVSSAIFDEDKMR